MCKISVVMTVFNGEKYIHEAIESILSQTFKDFEFIIVDNHSTDSSYKIISSFTDARLVCVRNEKNLGQTKALNIGIQKSKGEYIARMDADDIAFSERLEKQYEFLENNPSMVMVGSWCLNVDQQGKSLNIFKVPTDPLTIKCFLLGSGDLTSWCIVHPTVLIRKSAIEEIGLYNDKQQYSNGYPQDYELWGRLSKVYDIANIGRPLLKYRILQNSESRHFNDKSLQDRFDISAKKVKSYLPHLNQESLSNLTNMLEYRPQISSKDGGGIFELFDEYFEVAIGHQKAQDGAWKLRDKMKFYYLPQLFKTNKILSLKEYLRFISLYPSYIFDMKMYRKIIKVFLLSILKEEWYDFFVKRILLYQ